MDGKLKTTQRRKSETMFTNISIKRKNTFLLCFVILRENVGVPRLHRGRASGALHLCLHGEYKSIFSIL